MEQLISRIQFRPTGSKHSIKTVETKDELIAIGIRYSKEFNNYIIENGDIVSIDNEKYSIVDNFSILEIWEKSPPNIIHNFDIIYHIEKI